MGSILTTGTIYVLSDDGAIAPAADLGSGDYVSIIGIAVSATVLDVQIHNSGVEIA